MLKFVLVFLLIFNYSQIFSIDPEKPAPAPVPSTTKAVGPRLTIAIPAPTPRATREQGHVHVDSPRPSFHTPLAICETCFSARSILHTGHKKDCQICLTCSTSACDCMQKADHK